MAKTTYEKYISVLYQSIRNHLLVLNKSNRLSTIWPCILVFSQQVYVFMILKRHDLTLNDFAAVF